MEAGLLVLSQELKLMYIFLEWLLKIILIWFWMISIKESKERIASPENPLASIILEWAFLFDCWKYFKFLFCMICTAELESKEVCIQEWNLSLLLNYSIYLILPHLVASETPPRTDSRILLYSSSTSSYLPLLHIHLS